MIVLKQQGSRLKKLSLITHCENCCAMKTKPNFLN